MNVTVTLGTDGPSTLTEQSSNNDTVDNNRPLESTYIKSGLANTTYTMKPITTANTTYSIGPVKSGMETFSSREDWESGLAASPVLQKKKLTGRFNKSQNEKHDVTMDTSSELDESRVSETTFCRSIVNPITEDTSVIGTDDWMPIYEEFLDKFKEEAKVWNSIKADYENQAIKSESRLQAVLESDDCRRVLHGVRRSAYVAPPQFDLNCTELVNEVEDLINKASNAAISIIQSRRKQTLLCPPLHKNTCKATKKEGENNEEWQSKHGSVAQPLLSVKTCETSNASNMDSLMDKTTRGLMINAMNTSE